MSLEARGLSSHLQTERQIYSKDSLPGRKLLREPWEEITGCPPAAQSGREGRPPEPHS